VDPPAIADGAELSAVDPPAVADGTELSAVDPPAVAAGTELSAVDPPAVADGKELSAVDPPAVADGRELSAVDGAKTLAVCGWNTNSSVNKGGIESSDVSFRTDGILRELSARKKMQNERDSLTGFLHPVFHQTVLYGRMK
jgi:hypothetical protein